MYLNSGGNDKLTETLNSVRETANMDKRRVVDQAARDRTEEGVTIQVMVQLKTEEGKDTGGDKTYGWHKRGKVRGRTHWESKKTMKSGWKPRERAGEELIKTFARIGKQECDETHDRLKGSSLKSIQ